MPPASANAMASLVRRRSKCCSRAGSLTPMKLVPCVGADRPVGAQLAGPVGVLRSEAEVAGCDARGRGLDSSLDTGVIRRHLSHLAAPQVEEHKTRVWTSGDKSPTSGQTVQPQLDRVGLEKRRIQRGVGLEVDEDRLPIELADPVDETTHPSLADPHVEPDLDGKGPGRRERMAQ